MKILAERAILVLARPEEDLVPTDARLLREARPLLGEADAQAVRALAVGDLQHELHLILRCRRPRDGESSGLDAESGGTSFIAASAASFASLASSVASFDDVDNGCDALHPSPVERDPP